MASTSRVTAAVLTYDGRHLLEVLMPSLAAQTLGADLRVVVVDNGSSDGTQAWLAEAWPEVEVVAFEQNIGVTAALDVCLRTGADGEYVAVLNNDLELHPECLAELAAALDAHPEAGSAAAKLLSYDDRRRMDGAGDVFDWAGLAGRRGHGEPDDGRYDAPRPIFGASFVTALYRGTAIEAVGGLDEHLHAFYEDVDWALRAQLAGWSCRYAPSAVAYHMGATTLGKGMNEFTQYRLWRNSVWLVAKNYPASALLRWGPRFLLVRAIALSTALREGRGGLWWRAHRDALLGLPGVLRRRRAVQATRRVSLARLDAAIRPDQPPLRLLLSRRRP